MYNPLVSIIIPVYNGSNFLSQAIDSALAQTYKNLEIIVVNDGSKDGGATEQIAQSFGDKIKYFPKENGGVSSALNHGIKQMRGEWFSWLSHDDLYEEDKVERQIVEINKYIKDSNDYMEKKIILLSESILIDKGGHKIKRSKLLRRYRPGNYSGKQMFTLLIKDISINGCALLLPKKCFSEVGLFDTSLKYLQDYEFWYRLMLRDFQFVCIDHISVKTRVHSQQTQAQHPELFYIEREKTGFDLVDIFLEDVEKNSDLLISYLNSCAREGNFKVEKYIFKNLRNMDILTLNNKLVCSFEHCKYILIKIVKKIYKLLYNKKFRN
jgi:glycosyltransferase involved in cell wall biosynthesis